MYLCFYLSNTRAHTKYSDIHTRGLPSALLFDAKLFYHPAKHTYRSNENTPNIMQFTIPGGRHAVHHAGLLQKAGAARVLRAAAAATTASIEAKVFARIVLRNLEHHQTGTST